MARKRLTTETLSRVNQLSAAREHVRLAERVLGPSATDNEVLATADTFSRLSPEKVREINRRVATIAHQNRRLAAAPDGADDPWEEGGPQQPDPTNNQAYTKQIMTTPDHAVQDSLQKRDIHSPTASRASQMSRQTRQRYRLAANDDLEEGDTLEDRKKREEEEGVVDDRLEDLEGDSPEEEGLDDDQLGDEIDDSGEGDLDDLDGDGVDEVRDDDMEGLEGEGLEDMGDEDFDDLNGDEEGLDLDGNEDEIDDLLDPDSGGDFGDEESPDIFDDVDDEDELRDEMGHPLDRDHVPAPAPASASSRRQPTSSRQPRGRRVQQGSGNRRTAAAGGQGPARMSIDEILNIHDEDIERTASTPLEGDDLEALLGARVDRAGHRVASNTRPNYDSPSARSRRTMLEQVWDTENEPEIIEARRRRGQGDQQAQPRRRAASQPQQPSPRQVQASKKRSGQRMQQPPDRRRGNVNTRNNDREFDQVFGVDGMPDVSKFFD